MRTGAMRTLVKSIVFSAALMLLLPVMGQGAGSVNQGYLAGDSNDSIVTSSVGLCWYTSDLTPARAVERCDPVSKPVAIAPAVKPVVIVALAPAQDPRKSLSQKISFLGNALFAFDKSALKPEGKEMLDGLISQFDGAVYDSILATGHADRFGGAAYNQKLSERRANAVKEYLVSRNIQASSIDTAGKGETQPMTQAGDCRGAKSVRVVACLQPDRRVDIEMKGAKTVTGSR